MVVPAAAAGDKKPKKSSCDKVENILGNNLQTSKTLIPLPSFFNSLLNGMKSRHLRNTGDQTRKRSVQRKMFGNESVLTD